MLAHRSSAVRAPRAAKSPAVFLRASRSRAVQVQAAQKVTDLPANLKKIVMSFQMVPDPMARYKQLLFFANKLEPLPAEDHIPSNKVEGCVSQVWVKPELRADGLVYWKADSDSQLTKGLAALLVQGLSGCKAEEVLAVEPDFIEMLGLKQSLTPSRNNGFLNMFRLMQRKSLELLAQQAQGASPGSSSGEVQQSLESSSNSSNSTTPIRDGIQSKLTATLSPLRLNVLDQSADHAGHAAMTARPGKAGLVAETHFRVEVVSAKFEGQTLVQRHRLINSLLEAEFTAGLHALSLDTKTPTEAGIA